MAISMDNLPAAEGGFKVTRDMIERWCAAYDDERLPDGYAFDGLIKPGEWAAQPQGRPGAGGENSASFTFEAPMSPR